MVRARKHGAVANTSFDQAEAAFGYVAFHRIRAAVESHHLAFQKPVQLRMSANGATETSVVSNPQAKDEWLPDFKRHIGLNPVNLLQNNEMR